MPRVSNKAIVEKLKEGDRSGCVMLMDMFYARFLSEATGMFRISTVDAEEIVSDALLAVAQQIQKFEFRRGESDFSSWVVTIFKNKVRDFVRHQAITDGLTTRFQESAFEDPSAYSQGEREVVAAIVRNYEESLRSDEVNPKDDLCREKLRCIGETLDQMESWERVLLRCRALEVPYEDIARYTGKPVTQLKVYHSRVKKKFVKLLAVHYPEVAAP